MKVSKDQENRQRRQPLRANPFSLHREVLRDSAVRLLATPVASLMTIFVIAIALLLPAMLQVIADNLGQISEQFRDSGSITLYLESSLSEDEGVIVSNNLRSDPAIAEVLYISRAEALAEFERDSGFGDVLSGLGDNPLPASIVVIPASTAVALANELFERLSEMPEVEVAQIDQEWIQRLGAFRALVQRIGFILSLILGLGVLFIVGNTIRLAIENRKSEIQVIRLVGGTRGFIARPFLYTGLLLGTLAGALTCVLITLVGLGLSVTLDNLLSLYDNDFSFRGFGLRDSLVTIAFGALLGWFGALVSTLQHLMVESE